LVNLKKPRGVRFLHIWNRRAVSVRAQKQNSDHAKPRFWELLNTEKAFDPSYHAGFFCDLSKRSYSRRFTIFYLPPWDCPLPFKRVAETLANEKDFICLSNYSADANYGFGHVSRVS